MTFEITPTIHKNRHGEEVEVYFLCVVYPHVKLWLTREKQLSRDINKAGFLGSWSKCGLAMREIEQGKIREGLAYGF